MLDLQTDQKLTIPALESSYENIGSFKQGEYSIDCSGKLVKTAHNYDDSKKLIPEGFGMSLPSEELEIQMQYKMVSDILKKIDSRELIGKNPDEVRNALLSFASSDREKSAVQYVFNIEAEPFKEAYENHENLIIDPRNATPFNDLFGRNDDNWYAWQWTEMALRTPKGRDPNKYETDKDGRKLWVREAFYENKVVGPVWIPEGNGYIVKEWNHQFGIPTVTENIECPHTGFDTHFYFNPSEKEVVVGRAGNWRLGDVARCLDVFALYGRSGTYSDGGFRPVIRGSIPEISADFFKADENYVQKFLQQVEEDKNTMIRFEFENAYKLKNEF